MTSPACQKTARGWAGCAPPAPPDFQHLADEGPVTVAAPGPERASNLHAGGCSDAAQAAIKAINLRRQLLARASELNDLLAPFPGRFPETETAIAALGAALATELPADSRGLAPGRRRRPRSGLTKAGQIKVLHGQLRWARSRRAAADKKLHEMGRAREPTRNALSIQWIVRVCLANPVTSARGFAASWADLVGTGQKGVSRKTITKIRNAFVEFCLELNRKELCQAVAAQVQRLAPSQKPARGAARPRGIVRPASATTAAVVVLMHVQDEARMRLRQTLDDRGSRSRTASVQAHVCALRTGSGLPIDVYSEIDALANKTGETLATSFEAELRRVAGIAANGVPKNGISLDCVYFLAHVLIGDGVAANAKVGDFLFQTYASGATQLPFTLPQPNERMPRVD